MEKRMINNSDEDLESRIIKILIEEYEHQYGVKCTYQEINEKGKTAWLQKYYKEKFAKDIEKPLPDVFAEHGVVSTQHQNTVKNENHALLYPSYKPNIS